MRFASFFSKLAEMMERLAGHLEYVIEYGERFIDYPKIQSVRIISIFFPLSIWLSLELSVGFVNDGGL